MSSIDNGTIRKVLTPLLLLGIGAGVYFFFGPAEFSHGQGPSGKIHVELRDPSLNLLSSGGVIVVSPFSAITGVTADFTGVPPGLHEVSVLGAFGFPFYEIATCTYPIAGTPCTPTLSDFIPGSAVCPGGANACATITTSPGQASNVVFRFTNTAPVPGEVRIARVDEAGVLFPFAMTIAQLDGPSDGQNPGQFINVSAGPHTARALDADLGLNVWVGACPYPQGGSVCTPVSFTPASCTIRAARTCSLGITVNSNEVTNVVFIYAPPGFSPSPPPPLPPPPPPLPPSLTCNPIVQSVLAGTPATVTLSGGKPPFLWLAPNGTPPNQLGGRTNFTTTFSLTGTQYIGVFDSTTNDIFTTQRALCTVLVSAPPPPPPPPSPLVTGWSWGGDNAGVSPMIGGVGWISMGN